MSFSRLVSRWKGLALTLIAVIATVWLGFTGQLGLYIHPRYYVFTLIMAGFAVVLIVGAFAVVPYGDVDDEHESGHGGTGGAGGHGEPGGHDGHDGHRHPPLVDDGAGRSRGSRRTAWSLAGAIAAVVLVGVATATLLIVPPTALTSAAVEQRSMNGSSSSLAAATSQASGDTSTYTVKDWATELRQGADAVSLTGQTATLTGFVTPDADDPDNMFYIARFVVTCCAVDAQPVGVPVYDPGWPAKYATDSWVTATGTFQSNPSVLSAATTVLQPTTIEAVPQPAEPYVY